MIHDVDLLLERLVRRDALAKQKVELLFDAPNKDWVARRNAPAIDLYLYDIREDLQRRYLAWEDAKGEDGHVRDRGQPSRRFKLAYLVTAWTQRPEDEHLLLSDLLSCFIRNPMIDPADLEGSLAEPGLPVYVDVGQPPSQDRSLADVWSALGGELKPSLDVVVTAPIVVRRSAAFGPPVLQGPAIGLSSGNGRAETRAAGRRATGPGAPGPDELPIETLPTPSAIARSGEKPSGLAIRARGLRTR
jgi:Pvc16 N-terminal domain